MVLAIAQKSKYFSRETDVVLLCLTNEHGYGNWTKIKQAIRRDTRCRFDHLFMSRNEQDLARRIDMLVKALDKEKKYVDIHIEIDSEESGNKVCGTKRTFGEATIGTDEEL